jgi:hypothetical protein
MQLYVPHVHEGALQLLMASRSSACCCCLPKFLPWALPCQLLSRSCFDFEACACFAVSSGVLLLAEVFKAAAYMLNMHISQHWLKKPPAVLAEDDVAVLVQGACSCAFHKNSLLWCQRRCSSPLKLTQCCSKTMV